VLSLADEEESIRGLASLFFSELAGRSNNPVYNLLGDIIGSLSGAQSTKLSSESTQMEGAVPSIDPPDDVIERSFSTEQFQTAMAFLLKFVGKERCPYTAISHTSVLHFMPCTCLLYADNRIRCWRGC